MNALEILRRSASIERAPAPPSKREIDRMVRDDIARWDRHQAESGFTGDARVWTHEDGREVWEHKVDGEWVPYP